MSLVPYREGSVILDDPESKSLVIVYPSSGSLEFFQQVHDTDAVDLKLSWDQTKRASISSFVCPQCGTEINPKIQLDNVAESAEDEEASDKRRGSRSVRQGINLSRKYFKLLESSHRHYTLRQEAQPVLLPPHQYFIPENLFIPGYFHKFFETLSLLGNGARGSVYKVVHKIGDIDLGIFALKKIPIGNDMLWFQKCIREVKALSSLTHRSANLITYNHVWLEMNTACGLVRTLDGKQSDTVEDIPCIFILQQYCCGGNLEDFISKDVFQRFHDHQSSEERKKRFIYRRTHPKKRMGLSSHQIVCFMRDIARGLLELHDIGLIHRDLKPSNCLLLEKNTEGCSVQDYFPTIVIGDLGEAQMNGESRTATGATGTLEFTAPEVIISSSGNATPTNYNEYTFASDMYSLGMICYFIVFGDLPFESQLEITDLKQKIRSFKPSKKSLIRKHDSLDLLPIDMKIFDLMEMLLSPDINSRPSAEDTVAFLDGLLSSTGDEKSINTRNDELEFMDAQNYSAVAKLDNKSNLETIQTLDEIVVAPSKPESPVEISSLTLVKKRFCLLVNLGSTILILLYSQHGPLPAYFALFLLGVSLKTTLRGQKWILAVFIIMTAMALLEMI